MAGSLQPKDLDTADFVADVGEVPVGHLIRDLRKAKRITLVDLAERIGRSLGYVSQVERGISEVSITTLKEIADALEVQISWFFQGGSTAPLEERDLVVRRGQRKQLNFARTGVTEELLSPHMRGASLMILGTFDPAASTGAPSEREAEESGLVLEGTLTVEIDGQVIKLETGDSFVIPAGAKRTCKNLANKRCVVAWCLVPAIY